MSPATIATRLPVLAPVKAALLDVFGKFPSTLKAVWVIFVLLMLLVEAPMLFLAEHAQKYLEPGRQTLDRLQKEGSAMDPLADTTKPDPLAATPDVVTAAATAMPDQEGRLLVVITGLVVYTLQMVLLFCFMAGWYRQLLFNEDRGGVIKMRLGRAEWDLMKTSVKAGLALMPFIFVGVMVATAAYPNGDASAAPSFNFYPYVIAIGVVTLYLRARLALAYPATMMGDTEAPVRQSWGLTKNQGWRLVLGNVLVDAIMIGGIFLLFMFLSWGLSKVLPPEQATGDAPLAKSVVFILKGVAELSMLLYTAVLSAYHARAYAYLVRSSSNSSAH